LLAKVFVLMNMAPILYQAATCRDKP